MSARLLRRIIRACFVLIFAAECYAPAASAQKKKTQDASQTNDDNTLPRVPVPVSDEIEHEIGLMLGAWQAGDIEAMHKFYDDNASFVSGSWGPPLVGWQNYAAEYQKQRERIQGMQFIRRNTVVFTRGDMAWAMYQWEFDATVDHAPFSDRGQTTLLFARAGDRWVIVHNHTSEICAPPSAAPNSQPRSPLPQSPPGQGSSAQKPPATSSPRS